MQLADLWAFADQLQGALGAGYAVISGPISVDDPDRVIGVMDYNPSTTVENWQGDHRVQIMCRGAPDADGLSSYNDAHGTADAVTTFVKPPDRVLVVNLTGGHRATVTMLGEAHPLGLDEQGRWRFSINVALNTIRA